MSFSLFGLAEVTFCIVGLLSFLTAFTLQLSLRLRQKVPMQTFGIAMGSQVVIFAVTFLTIGYATSAPWSRAETIDLVVSQLYLPTIILSPRIIRWFRSKIGV